MIFRCARKQRAEVKTSNQHFACIEQHFIFPLVCEHCKVIGKQGARMFIKLTLIVIAFVPLIIGRTSESPASSGARVGRFFGWFSGKRKRGDPDISSLLTRSRGLYCPVSFAGCDLGSPSRRVFPKSFKGFSRGIP